MLADTEPTGISTNTDSTVMLTDTDPTIIPHPTIVPHPTTVEFDRHRLCQIVLREYSL